MKMSGYGHRGGPLDLSAQTLQHGNEVFITAAHMLSFADEGLTVGHQGRQNQRGTSANVQGADGRSPQWRGAADTGCRSR